MSMNFNHILPGVGFGGAHQNQDDIIYNNLIISNLAKHHDVRGPLGWGWACTAKYLICH